MVVAEEDDVEAGHLAGYRGRGVLLLAVGDDAAVVPAVEKSEDKVGLLVLLDVFHPFLGTRHHFLKLHALPDALVEPVGNGGREHADDHNLHPFDIVDGVGLYVAVSPEWPGTTRGTRYHNVGSKQRAAHLAYPFVIHFVAWLNVVVAHGLGVVFHVVDDACGQVLVLGHDIVGPVDTGLPLQYVTVVDEQQVVAVLLALLLDIRVHTYQCSFDWLLLHEVVGEEVSVNVAGLNDFQLDGLGRGCSGQAGCQQHHGRQNHVLLCHFCIILSAKIRNKMISEKSLACFLQFKP